MMRHAFVVTGGMAVYAAFQYGELNALVVWLILRIAWFISQYREYQQPEQRRTELAEGIELVRAIKSEYEQLAQEAREGQPYQWSNN